MNIDPSQPLKNARHEAFARAWAADSNQAAAARAAGYSRDRARKTASELGTNRDVLARKQWLQAQTATASTMTKAEKREILASIARDGRARAGDRIAAVRVDNDLGGDGSEAAAQDSLAVSLRDGLLKRLSLVRP